MRRSTLTTLAATAIFVAACSTTANPPPTTRPAPLVTVELAASGLGDVLFGFDPDTVVADLTARFGAPDQDTNWIPAVANIFGTCPGESMRAIGWGSLVAIFIDDGQSDLGGWFFTYTYGYDYSKNVGGVDPRALNLQTRDGIGLGSTVNDLLAAWGDDVVIDGDADLDIWTFTATQFGFRGLLSGPDPTAAVTLIEPLEGCA
jgi:hypothetical protein